MLGDIIEVQIPPATTDPNRQTGVSRGPSLAHMTDRIAAEEKHKGYGFVTFASAADAQDAIDNMDLNELQSKVLRVNLARPSKMPVQGLGNKASTSLANACSIPVSLNRPCSLGIRGLAPAVREAAGKERWYVS